MQFYDSFEQNQTCYLVLEYADGGDLFDLIDKKGEMSDTEAAKYVREIIAGLKYCHSRGIIHKDIKPENIFISKNIVKIADFDLASFNDTDDNIHQGTWGLLSLEMIKEQSFDFKNDIWSLGCLIHMLFACEYPYCNPYGNPKLSSNLSKHAEDLINRILKFYPEERPTLNEILEHPWFQ